jgi:PadR family transcriptional regulator PadR
MYCKVLKIFHIFAKPKVSYMTTFGVYSLHKTYKDMSNENAKSQMRKGMLEYCVLLLLHRDAAYASDILSQLKEAELLVVEGTLYPLLTRLKNDGLLNYEWRESTQGPPRKYYCLTELGVEALKAMDEAWVGLTHTVEVLKSSITDPKFLIV